MKTANRCLKFKGYKHTVLHRFQSSAVLCCAAPVPFEKDAPEVKDFSPLSLSVFLDVPLFIAQPVKQQQ